MLISRTKKYIGILLALAIVLGCFIFNPEEVKADTGILLDQTYTITDSDYKFQFDGYCAAYRFTPDENGYYAVYGDLYMSVFYYKEYGVNHMTEGGYDYLDPQNNLIGFDVPSYHAFYMEAGVDYYLIHYANEYEPKSYGDFCVSKIEEYINFVCDQETDALKDYPFDLWIEVDATVNYDSVTFTWLDGTHGILQIDQDVPLSVVTLETNDYFDEEDFGSNIEYYYPVHCKAEIVYDGQTYTRDIYDFGLRPCKNVLATACWAEVPGSCFVFVNNFDTAGKVLTVNAGTFAPVCDVTYQWYVLNDYTECYELIEGQNSSQLSAEVLGDPIISFNVYDEWSFARKEVYCEVTFDDGLNTFIRKVYFDVIYGLENKFIGNKTITANYGDVISFPVEGGFEEPLKDLGYTYWYQWTGKVNTGNGEYQFGTMNTVSIDTSILEVEHGNEGDYSVINCICRPYNYGGFFSGLDNLEYEFRIYYTDDLAPDVKGIAVDSTNFPDDNFRQYVAEYIDVNHTGYISSDEIEYTTFIDVSNKNISDLTGINYFSNVQALYCSNNTMSSLDVSGIKNLLELRADGMGLSSINLNGCNYLKTAYLYGNMLSTINIDGCPYLKSAYQYGPKSMIYGGCKYYGIFDYYTMDTYDIYSGLVLDNWTYVENCEPLKPQIVDFMISRQPEDFSGMIGDECTLYVEAIGSNLTYQWQYMNVGSTAWCNASGASAKTDALTFTVTANANGRQYRCIVSDGTMEIESEVATITVVSGVTIVSQPVDFNCISGDIAEFSVEADGEDLEYQWQVYKNDAWVNCSNKDGAKTATLLLEAKESRNGSVYQCVITGRNGYTVVTDPVTLTVINPLVILNEPENFSGAVGETATFTVAAQGSGLKYQWQTLKNGSWTNCSINDGAKTATLSLAIKESRNGSKYKCVITDKNGSILTTEEVTLTVSYSLSIKQQPVNAAAQEGDTVSFLVVAEGTGLKYQWQVFKDGVWTNCSINDGAKTDCLTLEVKPSREGLKYHCIVTDKSGSSLTTNEVTLSTSKELKIVSEPLPYFFAYEGYYEEITIEAQGDGLKYQWQVLKNGTWTNCSINDGAKTNTLKLEGKYSRFGSQYHCVVRDKYGNEVTSSIFTFYVYAVPGTQHPESEHDDPVPNPDVDPIHPPEDEELTEPVDAADITDTVVTADVVDVVEVIDTAPEIVTETTLD